MRKIFLFAVLSFLYCGDFANKTRSNDEIIDIKVYDPVLRCNLFSSSIKKALKTLYSSNDSNVTCIVINYISNGSEFHLSQLCSQISHKCHNNFEINNELLEQLEEISLFIKKINSAFSHCSQVFSENSSALSGYYTIRAPNGSLISVYCDDNAFDNCSQVFKENSSALSGYYTMRVHNGSLISVYCDDNAFDNCSQVFKANSSALSGYYTMRVHNGSLISVYCDDNAFDNCSQVFKENSSALSEYYTMRVHNGSLISVYCDDNAFDNCSQVLQEKGPAPSGYYLMRAANGSLISVHCKFTFYNCSLLLHAYSSAPSGYYTLQAPNGSLISVYCDMEGSNCDCKGGWMRVGYLNMSEPGANCLPGLTQQQYNNIDHDVCGLPDSGTFSHTFFSTQGIHYNKVCGQLSGYQYRAPDGFNSKKVVIDSCYVDGISITYGSSPRKHIWTYANGLTSDNVPYPDYQ